MLLKVLGKLKTLGELLGEFKVSLILITNLETVSVVLIWMFNILLLDFDIYIILLFFLNIYRIKIFTNN